MSRIERAVKLMLHSISNSIVPDASISFMMVPEGTSLPNIEYTITTIEDLAIGTAFLRKATIEVASAAETNPDALTIAEAVEEALVTGTYDGIIVEAIINRRTIFETPSYGYGDEQTPAIAITTADLVYRLD